MSKENTNVEPILYDEKGNVINNEPLEEPQLIETEEDITELPKLKEDIHVKLEAEEAKHRAVEVAKPIKDFYNKKYFEEPTYVNMRRAVFCLRTYRWILLSEASKIPVWMREPWEVFIANQGTLYIGTKWGPIKPKYQGPPPPPQVPQRKTKENK